MIKDQTERESAFLYWVLDKFSDKKAFRMVDVEGHKVKLTPSPTDGKGWVAHFESGWEQPYPDDYIAGRVVFGLRFPEWREKIDCGDVCYF